MFLDFLRGSLERKTCKKKRSNPTSVGFFVEGIQGSPHDSAMLGQIQVVVTAMNISMTFDTL